MGKFSFFQTCFKDIWAVTSSEAHLDSSVLNLKSAMCLQRGLPLLSMLYVNMVDQKWELLSVKHKTVQKGNVIHTQ